MKSEEGLSRFLAFLRDEEERERQEEMERLKPVGTQVSQTYLQKLRCVLECSHRRNIGKEAEGQEGQ